MSGRCGTARATSRKTVRPPTPLSKMPIALAVGRWLLAVDSALGERPTAIGERLLRGPIPRRNARSPFAFDSVLLDLLVEIRSRRIDRFRRLGNIPPVLA